MKLLFQFTYSVIALIITASVSQSTKLGDKCTGDGNTGVCTNKCGWRKVNFPSDCEGGECCGYVACKEKNTGFNCMTEADCDGYTNQGGVCPGKNMCCIVLRVAVPSPELVADNSFSSFSADTVTENHFIDSFAPGVLNAFNIPSPPTEDDAQNQHLGYLGGGGGAQQAGGVNQQPEAVAAVANEGLWNE